ncbi:MAG: LacI family transcriptional regulator [Lachnospiraceae bacterium]|nr:LacI family transcriptional regulator [Lachnospiraceae bacterium]
MSTISRALNNHPDINTETKEMIYAKIKELGYVPNNNARNLKKTESNTIAVLVKGMTNPFFNHMIKVMEPVIMAKKYQMVIQHVDPNEDELDVALELVKERRLKGIVFLGGVIKRSSGKLEQLNVPFVLSTVSCQLDDFGINNYSSVSVDDAKESYKVTRYLIQKGHKKIALLAAAENDTSIGLIRLSGYKRALEEAGIEYDPSLVRYLKPGMEEYTMENGFGLTMDLFKDKCDFTALFAIADTMAIGAAKAILEKGKRIPEDIAVIGFDGIEMCKYYHPAISSLAQPIDEIAEETIRILFKVIEGENAHQHVIFEGKLVERESTK